MHILLAYGEGNLTKKLKAALAQGGHQAAVLPEGDPPRARYDIIFQLAHDPARTAEGTRLLLKKAHRDRSRLFLVGWRLEDRLYDEAFRFAQTLTEESLKKGEVEAVILNLGRLFGPGIPVQDSGALGHLISEFSQGNLLTLYGGGEDRDYYLYADDAVAGLVQALNQAKSSESYALAPSVPITSEAAAKLLYELGGGRHEIVFHRGLAAAAEKEKVPGKPLPDFQIKTPFHEGIVAILKTAPAAPRTIGGRLPKFRAPLLKLPRLKVAFRKPPRRLVIALVSTLIIFSPVIYLGANAGWGALQLQRAKTLLAQGEFTQASKAVESAAGSLARFGRIIAPARPLAEAVQAAAELAGQSETFTTALENLVKSRRGEAITPQSEEDFRELAAAFSSTQDRFALAWLEIQQEDSRLWQPLRTALEPLLEEGLRAARFGEAIARDLSEILGYKGERSYLLFFQNSAELWPGGGFVGALANLTLENGRIKALEFYDAYDFSQYYTKAGVWARNISLDPDFSQDAKGFMEIFERATGVQTDGAVGIDLRFAQGLLEITGPLELPDFEETVTAENFFEVTTAEVEKDFFPGSTKKKRFLEALGEAITAKLFSIEQGKYTEVGRLAWDELRSRNLLLYLGSSAANQAVAESGFGGLIEDSAGDYLLSLTHNAGTKGTVWVTREFDYRVFNSNREGTLRGELSITWHNNGLESWPAGTYEDLFRVLVPTSSQLVKAELEDENVTAKIRRREEHGKTSFEYRVKIDSGTAKTLTLTYDLSEDLNLGNLSFYRLLVQKQAGAYGDRFRFTFEKPLDYEIGGTVQTDGEEDLQMDGDNLIFEGSLEKDLKLKVEIKER